VNTDEPGFDDLVLRALRGESLGPDERNRIEAWKAAAPENRETFEELQATWQLLDARELPQWTLADAWRLSSAVKGRSSRARRIRWGLTGAASAAAIVALLLSTRTSPQPELAPTAQAQVYSTAEEARTTRLPDGTFAHLAPNSRLEQAQTNVREVRLEGRAFFAVAHDRERPFVVHAPGGRVRVLGTRFEVEARDSVVRVVVVDGRVEVGGSGGSVQIGEGERTDVERDGVPSRPRRVDNVYALIGWMRNALVFQSTPLTSVAREIEQRYDTDVEIRDPALRDRVVTAAFADQSLDEVVAVVCSVVNARCTVDRTANRVVIGS